MAGRPIWNGARWTVVVKGKIRPATKAEVARELKLHPRPYPVRGWRA